MAHPDRYTREQKAIRKTAQAEKAKELLSQHNKKKDKSFNKKKSAEDMFEMIDDRFLVPSKYVRDPLEWTPKSYNLDRQIIDFVRWLYCLYQTPLFMFEFFKRDLRPAWRRIHRSDNQKILRLIYFDWFLVIAQGGSFAKMAKDIFSKKEAHWFLNAPTTNSLEENIWWAKCRTVELDPSLTNNIVKRLFRMLPVEDKFWSSLIIFLKKEEDDLDLESLSDIMDYLKATHYNNQNFSLKGRTFGSLIKLSNDWHRDQQMVKFGSANLYWDGLDIPDWRWRNKKEEITWEVRQLHTSKQLMNEGRRMKHCVASYAQRCVQGHSAIFSLTSDDGTNRPEKEVTIELTNMKRLIQARGRFNKPPSNAAQKVLNKWYAANNIVGYYL
jgi:hypothetical protein